MAYLRDDQEKLEIDYPLKKIWAKIPRTVEMLEWKIQEIDDQTHKAKLKTKGAFLSYGSIIVIEAEALDENTCRMTLTAETPVTTITSMADFGRSRDRINQFVEMLAKQLDPFGKNKK